MQGDGAPRQLTRLNATLLAERDVAAAQPFDFKSFDGTPVQAFLTPPRGVDPGRKYPVILAIHGGPHGQQGPGFIHKAQVYSAAGYAVVMVNYRGSTGYGQKFSDGTVTHQNGNEDKDVPPGSTLLSKRRTSTPTGWVWREAATAGSSPTG